MELNKNMLNKTEFAIKSNLIIFLYSISFTVLYKSNVKKV